MAWRGGRTPPRPRRPSPAPRPVARPPQRPPQRPRRVLHVLVLHVSPKGRRGGAARVCWAWVRRPPWPRTGPRPGSGSRLGRRAPQHTFFCPKGCVRRVLYVLAFYVSSATATGPAAPTKGFERLKSAWRDDEETVRVGLTGCARDQPCASWGSSSCSAQVRCGAQPGATILGREFQKKLCYSGTPVISTSPPETSARMLGISEKSRP